MGVDTHDGLYWLAAASVALLVALAVQSMTAAEPPPAAPPAPSVYQHPAPVSP